MDVDRVYQGDCLQLLPSFEENSFDAIVTDPPYELTGSSGSKKGFMGKAWDGSGISFNPKVWQECLRVLKPGGHLLAFGGPRTYHRMACAIEDAGFEIRDTLAWNFGSGFPKSLNVGVAIDKHLKAERTVIGKSSRHGGGTNNIYGEGMGDGNIPNITAPATPEAKRWEGYGTSLKPAWEAVILAQKPLDHEMICLARKPLSESTIAGNVLKWGTGGLAIDKCRISCDSRPLREKLGDLASTGIYGEGLNGSRAVGSTSQGRWPANFLYSYDEDLYVLRDGQYIALDNPGKEAVMREFAKAGESKSPMKSKPKTTGTDFGIINDDAWKPSGCTIQGYADAGTPARYFQSCPITVEDYAPFAYFPKASKSDRGIGNIHPTCKPTSLIQYLARLSCPPGGLILDPFGGSGTTAIAALREGFHYVLIEQQPEYVAIAQARLSSIPAPLSTFAEKA